MATISSISGRVGQIADRAIPAGENLLEKGGFISQIVNYEEDKAMTLHKLGIQADEGDYVEINDMSIKIGRTGIYELDRSVLVKKLVFPAGGSADVIVDFVY